MESQLQAKYFVFYSRIANSTMIFPDGTLAGFVGGRYTTQDEGKAAYLNQAIKDGNQHIYIDKEKLQLTEEELDPMAEYKARIIAEYEAKKIAADGKSDKGSSEQGKLNVASTANFGALAAGSDSGASANVAAGTQGQAVPGPVGGAVKVNLPTK